MSTYRNGERAVDVFYVTDEQDVESVVVDGKILMENREILTNDTAKVAVEARELATRIQRSLAQRNRTD